MTTATAAETTVLITTFQHRTDAERFVDALKKANFTEDEIGVLTLADHESATEAGEGAAAGAIAGGALGAFAGAIATGLIPGVGPVIAAGLLAGLAGGAAAGAAAGGLVGALIGMGIPEEEAHQYASHLREGRTLVVVRAPQRYGEALDILRTFAT